ncbi:unannotated protein [freshwater metagenome]|uniref:Unannotated protein n=1 Tax=freshwater metagenome TaxID=449393 RepID=A0A6J7LEB0_9ZZZZ
MCSASHSSETLSPTRRSCNPSSFCSKTTKSKSHGALTKYWVDVPTNDRSITTQSLIELIPLSSSRNFSGRTPTKTDSLSVATLESGTSKV